MKSNHYEPVEIRLLDTQEALDFLRIGRTALETLVARGAIKEILSKDVLSVLKRLFIKLLT
jgi:hypothetical protein